jgi:predicted proteasome-type protease
VRVVADWWKAHYLQAGHKRLGRKLLERATSMATELEELVKD